MQELLDKCHPLGMFDSISTLAVASNMRELYRLVLVDTPLAPYFSESLTAGTVLTERLALRALCTAPARAVHKSRQLSNLGMAVGLAGSR